MTTETYNRASWILGQIDTLDAVECYFNTDCPAFHVTAFNYEGDPLQKVSLTELPEDVEKKMVDVLMDYREQLKKEFEEL